MALRTASQTDTKLALLSSLPLFRSLRRHEITDLGRHLELAELSAGTVLQQQGEAVGQWLVVVDGTVLRLRDGKPIALLPAGSTWGEALLVTSAGRGRPPSPETLVTLEPTTAVVADPRRWRSFLATHPGLGSGWTVPTYDDISDVLVAMEWALVVPR
jgi:CRP-like cAMP-binding protein